MRVWDRSEVKMLQGLGVKSSNSAVKLKSRMG